MSGQEEDTTTEVVTSVRLPREQHDRLRAIAASEHRTVSGQLRLVIAEYLDRRSELEEAA